MGDVRSNMANQQDSSDVGSPTDGLVMCVFSDAANIENLQSKKKKKLGWRIFFGSGSHPFLFWFGW